MFAFANTGKNKHAVVIGLGKEDFFASLNGNPGEREWLVSMGITHYSADKMITALKWAAKADHHYYENQVLHTPYRAMGVLVIEVA